MPRFELLCRLCCHTERLAVCDEECESCVTNSSFCLSCPDTRYLFSGTCSATCPDGTIPQDPAGVCQGEPVPPVGIFAADLVVLQTAIPTAKLARTRPPSACRAILISF